MLGNQLIKTPKSPPRIFRGRDLRPIPLLWRCKGMQKKYKNYKFYTIFSIFFLFFNSKQRIKNKKEKNTKPKNNQSHKKTPPTAIQQRLLIIVNNLSKSRWFLVALFVIKTLTLYR